MCRISRDKDGDKFVYIVYVGDSVGGVYANIEDALCYIVYKKNEKYMHDIKVEEDIRKIIKDYAEKMKTIDLAMESKSIIENLMQEVVNLITKKEEEKEEESCSFEMS